MAVPECSGLMQANMGSESQCQRLVNVEVGESH